jgi:hypothetical protein
LVDDSEVGIADSSAHSRTGRQKVSRQRQCCESDNRSDAVDSDSTASATHKRFAFELGNALHEQTFVIGSGSQTMDSDSRFISAVKYDVYLLVLGNVFAKSQIRFAIKAAMDCSHRFSGVLLTANEYFFYIGVINEQSE